jgi:hypothetical protein
VYAHVPPTLQDYNSPQEREVSYKLHELVELVVSCLLNFLDLAGKLENFVSQTLFLVYLQLVTSNFLSCENQYLNGGLDAFAHVHAAVS